MSALSLLGAGDCVTEIKSLRNSSSIVCRLMIFLSFCRPFCGNNLNTQSNDVPCFSSSFRFPVKFAYFSSCHSKALILHSDVYECFSSSRELHSLVGVSRAQDLIDDDACCGLKLVSFSLLHIFPTINADKVHEGKSFERVFFFICPHQGILWVALDWR